MKSANIPAAMRLGIGCGGAAVAALCALAGSAFAQAWPTKPIRIVVPYAAGGPLDDVARTLGVRMSETWSQTVVVDNRGGAGGSLGADMVARDRALREDHQDVWHTGRVDRRGGRAMPAALAVPVRRVQPSTLIPADRTMRPNTSISLRIDAPY